MPHYCKGWRSVTEKSGIRKDPGESAPQGNRRGTAASILDMNTGTLNSAIVYACPMYVQCTGHQR